MIASVAQPRLVCTSWAQVAALFGISLQHCRTEWKIWLPPKPPGGWPIADLIAAVREHDAKRYERQQDEGDPLLSSGSSPALEKYREAKAKLAELDLQYREGKTIDRSEAHEVITEAARLIRGAGEDLQRRFGADAQDILDQAINEVDRLVEERFGNPDEHEQPAAVSRN